MARPRLAILIFYNNHDAVVVHVMHLAVYLQIAHLQMHHYWNHIRRHRSMFVLTLLEPYRHFEIAPELPEMA